MKTTALTIVLSGLVLMAGWVYSAPEKKVEKNEVLSTRDSMNKLSTVAFQSSGDTVIFFEDFEPTQADWLHSDIRETNGLAWHQDTFNAYAGKSWWCGQSVLQGYRNNWYQILTTPDIDLTTAALPKLSFMHYYGTEYDYTKTPEENPWDGCHVRVSNDGWQTYDVIIPEEGYDAPDSLWVWEYHLEKVRGGMPGWHGLSNGWKSANFDLSSYVGQKIQIRFIFASDLFVDTRDDSRWLGWFLDNIEVKDGATILFFDDGEDTVIPTQLVASEGSGLYQDFWNETTSEYHSFNHSWKCDNFHNLKTALVSPWIYLTERENPPLLSFWVYVDLPDHDGDGDNFLEDYYTVEITSDGYTWEKLIHDFARSRIGADTAWVEMKNGVNYNGTLSLNQWMGKAVKLRWVVNTDENDDGGNGSGLYLDDIRVSQKMIINVSTDIPAYRPGIPFEFVQGDNGSAWDYNLKVRNRGKDPFTIESWKTGNTYFSVISPTFPQSVSPSQEMDVSVRFQPEMRGFFKDTLNLHISNAVSTIDHSIPISAGFFLDSAADPLGRSLYGQAVQAYDSAKVISATSSSTRNNRGVLLFLLQERTLANSEFSRASSIKGTQMNLGAVEAGNAEYDRALNRWSNLLSNVNTPTAIKPQIKYNIAWVYDEIDSLELAYNFYTDVIADTSANTRLKAKAYLGRGVTVFNMSQDSSAANSDFRQALALDPHGAGVLAQENLTIIVTGVQDRTPTKLPREFTLQQNYPNPFNPETTIKYQLPKASQVKLEIFNIVGQRVATLVDKEQLAGFYSMQWNGKDDSGRNVASGIYLYKLDAEGFVKVRKLTLVR